MHVKNTGRCKELLVPGSEVWLTAPGTPGRKTKYDLVAVRKSTGVKHIGELIKAKKEGYRAILSFVIQMEGVSEVRPNITMQPDFGDAWNKALKAGVEIWFLKCKVDKGSLSIVSSVP